MVTLIRIAQVVLCLLIAGCLSDPIITKSDSCTTLKRRGFTAPIVLRSNAIKAVNMLKEFPPPEHFTDVSLVVPESLNLIGVKSIYLDVEEESYPRIGECAPTSNGYQACRLSTPERDHSGFSVLLVAPVTVNGYRIVQAGEAYWLQISGCK